MKSQLLQTYNATIQRCAFGALILSAPIGAMAQKLVTPGYQFNSDPSCREINGRFYLFTTHDPFTVQFEKPNPEFKGMYDIHAYSTADFDNWVDHGSLLNTHDAGWHKGNAVWDGDAGIPANGKYYAYIPFRVNPDSEDNYGHFQIGVFVADKIEGPYSDVLGRPLTTFDGKAIFGLSPTVVYADNGDPYLIWGPDVVEDSVRHTVLLAKLKPNMIELAEPAHDLAVETINKCGSLEYFESPILFKHGDLWYLTYVGFKSWAGKRNCNYSESDPPGCYIQYATSKSMFGPFNRDIRHFIYPVSGGDLNIQQGICQYKGQWYVAYHTSYENIHRQACVTHLNFNPDGSLVPIHPDSDPGAGTPGISHLTLDAFANKREAEEFHARLNADDENGILGDYHFKIKDGGYLRFDRMDFGRGAAGFEVEVSCESPDIKGGKLEFRLDNPYGRKIGEASVAYTKGNTNYVVLTGPVVEATGIHDVCLVAHGTGGDNSGHLFNVNWFTFTRTYRPERNALFAVNCGGTGEDGLSADQPYAKGGWGYEGETTATRTEAVIYYNCNLPNALKTDREAATDHGTFSYKFAVPDGEYAVQLVFAETSETAYDSRKFDVSINGKRMLANFDILLAASGANRAATKEFAGIVVNDGMIDITLVSKMKAAKINAIRVFAANRPR
jgi:arabinoxylan arabinofuranohydrolase